MNLYGEIKGWLSRGRRDQQALPRLPFPDPVLLSVDTLVHWISQKIAPAYTGDGPRLKDSPQLGRKVGIGFPDRYTHPEVLIAGALNGTIHLIESDCDDVAALYRLGLTQIRESGRDTFSPPQLYDLISQQVIRIPSFPWFDWPSHTVCALTWPDGSVSVFDVNGKSDFPTWTEAIAAFGRAYRTTYAAHLTPYPY